MADNLRRQIDSLHAADPRLDSTAALGSLISPVAGSRVEKLVADALAKGATVYGGRHSVDGAIVQPLVLQNVQKGMDIYYQESFGPTVALFEFDTNEEAIQLANDTEYGLVASVFGDDIQDALAVARRIRSGSCHINGPTVHGKLKLFPNYAFSFFIVQLLTLCRRATFATRWPEGIWIR